MPYGVYVRTKECNDAHRVPRTEIACKNISKAMTGRKLSKQHIENLKIAHNKPEAITKQKIIQKIIKNTPEAKEKARQKNIEQFQDPIKKENHRKACKEAANRPEAIKRASEDLTKQWKDPIKRNNLINALVIAHNDPIVIEKQRKDMLQMWKDPTYRQKVIESHIEQWKDPVFAQKVIRGWGKCPNNEEISVTNFLKKFLPNEYKFTGDGSIPVDGLQPDWTNINGQMKLIEYLGEYHHADPNRYEPDDIVIHGWKASYIWGKDCERIKRLENKGYKVLIIWGREFKDLEKLKQKILEFNRR
jgi:hypothetical protein